MSKQARIIGLGRFGTSLARTLESLGCEVLAVDSREENVRAIANDVTQAMQLDPTREETLAQLELSAFDIVVVAAGIDMQSSLLCAMLCKELGAPFVVAKANTELHARVLLKMGVDKVVFPERDMGVRFAHSLMGTNIIDAIELSDELSIVEVAIPNQWVGKTLQKLDLKARMGLTALLIRRGEEMIVTPPATEAFEAGDVVVIVGNDKSIRSIEEMG